VQKKQHRKRTCEGFNCFRNSQKNEKEESFDGQNDKFEEPDPKKEDNQNNESCNLI